MKNIAIMGGTFNPIHYGHLMAAQCTMDSGMFDSICFMPSGNPPHKDYDSLEKGEHRYNMCQLAIEGNSHFSISDFELKRKGNVYSVDTFLSLNALYPDTKYWLIIGTDSLLNLESWYASKKLLKIGAFVVVHRSGYDEEEALEHQARLKECYGTAFINVHMPQMAFSSTDIRQRINDDKSIDYYVPESVITYITAHKLYQLGDANERI